MEYHDQWTHHKQCVQKAETCDAKPERTEKFVCGLAQPTSPVECMQHRVTCGVCIAAAAFQPKPSLVAVEMQIKEKEAELVQLRKVAHELRPRFAVAPLSSGSREVTSYRVVDLRAGYTVGAFYGKVLGIEHAKSEAEKYAAYLNATQRP